MKCTERLFLTADRTALVGEGDARGATLYAAPGDEIPDEAARRFGLIGGDFCGANQEQVPATVTADPAAVVALAQAAEAKDAEIAALKAEIAHLRSAPEPVKEAAPGEDKDGSGGGGVTLPPTAPRRPAKPGKGAAKKAGA